jgi:hypothetical protein
MTVSSCTLGTQVATFVCLLSQSSTLNILFHVDSGAGQSMCSCPDAFLSLRSCAIEVVGVTGSLPIFGIGTVMLVARSSAARPMVVLIHDCLLSQGSSFNLLSVSQSSGLNSVDFTVGSPLLCVHSRDNPVTFPLVLQEGLYSFFAEPLHPNDDRARILPRFDWTPKTTELSPALVVAPGATPLSPTQSSLLGTWFPKLLSGSTLHRRILAFPVTGNSDYDSELRAFWDGFLSPTAAPPARRTYDPANPIHMANLSARFMGAGG